MKTIITISILAALVTLTACSMSGNVDAADAAVVEFHVLLDAGRFDELYDAADDELKAATIRKDFVDLLGAVSRKLGEVVTTQKTGWRVQRGTGGSFVTVAYATSFAHGEAVEQFTFRMHDGEARLLNYHINSNALIIN